MLSGHSDARRIATADETWVTTDGVHIVVNIVEGMQKRAQPGPRPAPWRQRRRHGQRLRYYAVRGRVVSTTTEGGRQSIDEISHKYLGIPYPNFSGTHDETRVIVTIAADSIHPAGSRLRVTSRRAAPVRPAR